MPTLQKSLFVVVDCPQTKSSENLEIAIAGFAAIGVVGFSVTIPHKQAIMPLLAEIIPIAQAISAVNTLVGAASLREGIANNNIDSLK